MNETKDFFAEFETVDILVKSHTKSGRTDAFIIAFTKMEKQVRRIFTYLVYQYPVFNLNHYRQIIDTVASKRYLYFRNFIQGFDAICPKSFESIVGAQPFSQLLTIDLPRIKSYRDKILHGQPTGKNLAAEDLVKEIDLMRNWCLLVATNMDAEIGFDGLQWNSFRKNNLKNIATTYKVNITTIQGIDDFIENNMK